MRNRTGIWVGSSLVLLIAAALPSATRAEGRRSLRRTTTELLQAETFNVSGEYSGTLSGDIVIDGASYPLASNAQAYEIGRGTIPLGSTVDDRHVFLSGIRSGGSVLVFSVIVRPPDEVSLDASDPSRNIQLRSPSAPE